MSVDYIDPIVNIGTDASSVTLNNLSILYIEDDNTIKKKVTSFLVEIFKNVETASSGREGLSKFIEYNQKKSAFDMILIDSNIQEVNVLYFIVRIKKISVDTPCIFMTDNNPDLILRAINMDVYSFLIKPLKIYELVYALKKAYLIKLNKKLYVSQ